MKSDFLRRQIKLPTFATFLRWLFIKLPTFGRFVRWLFSWRSVRAALFALLMMATLIALFYVVENWRGRYAWKQYRAAAEQKGAQFDFNAFIPPPVPDEQNFAMTPLLRPLFDYEPGTHPIVWRDTNGWQRVMNIGAYRRSGYEASVTLGDWTQGQRIDLERWQGYYRNELSKTNRARGKKTRVEPPQVLKLEDIFPTTPQRQSPWEDVLLALTKFDAEMGEIELASQRPHSRFPVHYHEGISTPLAHLAKLRAFAMMFQLRAAAELMATNTGAAFADLQTIFRLADALKTEPFIISQLVRVKLNEQGLHTLWEGMCDHRWSEPQLAEVQKRIASLDLESEFTHAFVSMAPFEGLISEQILRNRAAYVKQWANTFPGIQNYETQFYLRYAPSGWFYQNEIVRIRRIDGIVASLQKTKASGVLDPIRLRPVDQSKIYERLVDFPGGFLTNITSQLPHAHMSLKLAEVACALERFHLAHQTYPETLAELMPRLIAKLPSDFMDGQPLRYQRLNEHGFKLYSIGLNLKDDDGTFPAKDSAATGDWVWEIR